MQPSLWNPWPVLEILEAFLPWPQRVIQLVTVQGYEEVALGGVVAFFVLAMASNQLAMVSNLESRFVCANFGWHVARL